MTEMRESLVKLDDQAAYQSLGAALIRKAHDWKPSKAHILEVLVDHEREQIHLKWVLPNEN